MLCLKNDWLFFIHLMEDNRSVSCGSLLHLLVLITADTHTHVLLSPLITLNEEGDQELVADKSPFTQLRRGKMGTLPEGCHSNISNQETSRSPFRSEANSSDGSPFCHKKMEALEGSSRNMKLFKHRKEEKQTLK